MCGKNTSALHITANSTSLTTKHILGSIILGGFLPLVGAVKFKINFYSLYGAFLVLNQRKKTKKNCKQRF